jgi:c-di-GMP-binding flagellar brake protein YcgR
MTSAITPANSGNRRRNFRYSFTTDVTYCSTTAAGAALVGRGTTIDMSAGGILVELDRTLEPGSIVQMSLAWPGIYHNCGYVRLDVTCQVLRSEDKRIALQIRTHEFRVPRAVRPTQRQWGGAAA